ncbi:MAG: alpha-galactosidase [Clostridiales bacterium]|nr:alpha-galactosidase [Clostridiales bacterium]
MNKKILFFTITGDEDFDCILAKSSKKDGVEIYDFDLFWNLDSLTQTGSFKFSWTVPINGFMYRWTPDCKLERNLVTSWGKQSQSMISSSAPLDSFYDGNSVNKYTWALSECAKLIYYNSGAYEETGELECKFELPVKQYTNLSSARIAIRIDRRNIPMCEAVKSVSQWWTEECNMESAYVPEKAKNSVYSFWYSYHQKLSAKAIEDECKRAKEVGFDVCIVDDGWQTDDSNRGYAYCGDWENEQSKIPDMAAHVKAVHDIGLKYILWYSVPFMGSKAKRYAEFKNMTLCPPEGNSAAVLDPRYKKVRDYLIDIYKTALIEWDLDGFKLDFIDEWREYEKGIPPYNPDMDIPVLYDAVDKFMTDVMNELKSIKGDVMIEFRQKYIGPNMRKYGNMFRVADCPNDILSNRAGVLDLRMIMGNSAVHSDMLMWHKDETPERAALQIISVLFGVLQYSQRLEEMSEETLKMTRFWTGFMKEHRDVLLNAPLTSYEPQLLYTWAKATKDDECITVVYTPDKCVWPDMTDTIYLVNGSEAKRIIAEIYGNYSVKVLNCLGETIYTRNISAEGITEMPVPIGGILELKKIL